MQCVCVCVHVCNQASCHLTPNIQPLSPCTFSTLFVYFSVILCFFCLHSVFSKYINSKYISSLPFSQEEISSLSLSSKLVPNWFHLFGIHYVVVANKNIEPRMKTPHIKSWFYIKLSLCSVLFGLKSSLHLSSDTVFAVLHTLLRLYCVHILSVSHPPSAAAVSFLLFFFNFSSTTFIFGSDLLKYLLLRHNVFIIPWASGSCFQGCSKKLPPHKSLHMCLCCTLLPICYHITPNSFQICQL